MGTLYAAYGDGPWYVGASLGVGDLDYSTTRNITLGAVTRTEIGDTGGWHFVGRAAGGYWFTAGDWMHGPFAEAHLPGHPRRASSRRTDPSSTAMTFGEQKRDVARHQPRLAGGGQDRHGAPVRARDLGVRERRRRAQRDGERRSAWAARSACPAYKPDDNWALFNARRGDRLRRVTGYIMGRPPPARATATTTAITVGVRVPL